MGITLTQDIVDVLLMITGRYLCSSVVVGTSSNVLFFFNCRMMQNMKNLQNFSPVRQFHMNGNRYELMCHRYVDCVVFKLSGISL